MKDIHPSLHPHNRYEYRRGRDTTPRFRDPRTLEDHKVSSSHKARLTSRHTIIGIPRPSRRQGRAFVFGLRRWTWRTLSTSLRLGRRSHDLFVFALVDGRGLGTFRIFVAVRSLGGVGRGGHLFTTSRTGTGLGRHGGRDLIFFKGHFVERM